MIRLRAGKPLEEIVDGRTDRRERQRDGCRARQCRPLNVDHRFALEARCRDFVLELLNLLVLVGLDNRMRAIVGSQPVEHPIDLRVMRHNRVGKIEHLTRDVRERRRMGRRFRYGALKARYGSSQRQR